ncbi:MAG: ribosomal L7Ae/L30e/S12e/Gadd45 family protein [Gemmatimonadetes bacterium]|nr:ribosomal L7Ae/L30e/S12e/Gadd45 family protein [Gemmatimonadota bacterium]
MTKSVHPSVTGLLGLAVRAGQVKGGTEAVKKSVHGGKSRLVILAEDASEGTKRSFRRLAGSRGVPVLECHSSLELGSCLNSAPKVVLSILDRHFASGMLKKACPAGGQAGPERARPS